MRYLCVHCDHRFEHRDEGKPRCPKCMRRNSLEALGADASKGGMPRWAIPAMVAAVLVVAVGGYAWWAWVTPGLVSGEVPLRPLDRGDLRDWLAHEKVEAGELAALLVPDASVEDFAKEATKGAEGPKAKAEAMVRAIVARAEAKAFVPWATSHPREAPMRTAAQTLQALQKDDARHRLYPLEVAALATAALRAVDVPAMLVEAWEFADDRSPPDPSGHFGYFLVGVWPEDPDAEVAPTLSDPYHARGAEPAEDGMRVLTDLQALAAAMTTEAARVLVDEGDTSAALTLAEGALRLDRRSPAVRTVRGAVLMQTGGVEEGGREFEAAAEIRRDAPRRKNLAALLVAHNEKDAARREISAALEQYPDYADAHALQAALHMEAGETEQARRALETAERFDPHLPMLPQIWSQYHLQQGDAERAVDQAKEAVRRRPHDWQARLHAAQVYRALSRYDDMRREARKALEIVPEGRRAGLEQLITQVLGPTALDEPLDDMLAEGEDDEDFDDLLPDPGNVGSLELDSPSLLGDGQRRGPGLGDGEGSMDLSGSEGDPLILGADPSTLKLRSSGQKLKLDLSD
jgi:tetratricopeptide (TPR) repeat protein